MALFEKMATYQVYELVFESDTDYPDPFRDVQLHACFRAPDGSESRVPGFWDGGRTWRIRYSSGQAGVHRWSSDCNVDIDRGLHGLAGNLKVLEYRGDNPLYRHGPIGRQDRDPFLSHRDGTPFFWLGDTWWMGLTSRLDWPTGFQELAADRLDKGFTVVQIVAGLYPDMEPFDLRGANEAGFPWDPDYRSIRPEYFAAADRRIAWLADCGLVPCIVGCWGFFMKFAGKQAVLDHWRYLIARWGAYPVAWCVAGEANMAFYGDERIACDEHLRRSRRDWNDVVAYVRANDPFSRLITIHPTQNGHDQIEDETLLDLDMLQTGHGGPTTLMPHYRQVRDAVARKSLPVIVAETCYEGICQTNAADIQRYLIWESLMLGVCGYTYGANGIWQVNTISKPYGASPHGAQWGDTPWQVAMRLPGSTQVGLAKRLWTRFDWPNIEPHPEWVDQPCTGETLSGCYAAGIPRRLRLIFRPFFGGSFWNEDWIRGLEPDVHYHAFYFNPVNGAEHDIGAVEADATGSWRSPRVHAFQDWVLVLTGDVSAV